MAELRISINVEKTTYSAPSTWRLLGGADKADHIIKLCERNALKPANLLEVGAGDGAILRSLADRAFCEDMNAVEISQSGVDVMSGQSIQGLVSCQLFDGYHLPFDDNVFDLVILSHVLEHVEFERALLREIARVSKNQIIEIPMDCNVLNDEHYRFLGPSYGHINARSPESLRFLLWTEHMQVVDDLLGQYSLDVLEYREFVANSNERAPAAVSAVRSRHAQVETQLKDPDFSDKTSLANFYAVLCKRMEGIQTTREAIRSIKNLISSNRTGEAELIFRHWVPQARCDETAMELAVFCSDTGKFAFADFLVSACSGDGRPHVVDVIDKARARSVVAAAGHVPIQRNDVPPRRPSSGAEKMKALLNLRKERG